MNGTQHLIAGIGATAMMILGSAGITSLVIEQDRPSAGKAPPARVAAARPVPVRTQRDADYEASYAWADSLPIHEEAQDELAVAEPVELPVPADPQGLPGGVLLYRGL